MGSSCQFPFSLACNNTCFVPQYENAITRFGNAEARLEGSLRGILKGACYGLRWFSSGKDVLPLSLHWPWNQIRCGAWNMTSDLGAFVTSVTLLGNPDTLFEAWKVGIIIIYLSSISSSSFPCSSSFLSGYIVSLIYPGNQNT